MKRTFTEIPTAWQRWQRLRHAGYPALGLGGLMVALLLLGNVAACSAGEALRRTDAAYRQPPQWRFFQRLLYRPDVRVTPLAAGAADLLGRPSPARPQRPGALAFTSQPSVTAVVGRTYRYQLQAAGAASVRYRLLAAPAGMTLDAEGRLAWTPARDQASGRATEVVVAAFRADGHGLQQAFTLFVAERSHPLGTDEAGRDLLAALVLGSRWAVGPGVLAVSLALLLGVLAGALAGYYGGRTEAVLSYVLTLSDALPALLLLFLAAVIFQYRLYPVMAVLGVLLAPGVAREVRTRVRSLRDRLFVDAGRELGLRDAEILWKDLVWHNTRPVLLARAFHGLALAVGVEVTLSYLRLGIQPPTVSWGTMILAGRGLIESHHYALAFCPALATLFAVAGYALLGSGLGQHFRVHGT